MDCVSLARVERIMKLTLPQVAQMFGADERVVEAWIRADGLPHDRVHGQYRFHRAELIEWATAHGRWVRDAGSADSLADAMARGGIFRDVRAHDTASALRAVVERIPGVAAEDHELVFEILLARESLGSTGIGDGIAIPHVRNPIVLDVERPLATLCLLERPIDFHAIDGHPVDKVFTIVAPNARSHLALLASLSRALHDRVFREALQRRADDATLLGRARSAS